MAKKRKTANKTAKKSSGLLDTSILTSFFESPAGRQLLADIVLAAAGAAAAALMASNRGKMAMGKAAMASAQSAVMEVVATAAQNFMSGGQQRRTPARKA